MPAYTFITDFRKGTYICQKAASDLRTACFHWKEDIIAGRYVEHLDPTAFSKAFDADIDEMPPVAIDSMQNVWLFHLLLGKDMLALHIIQTDTSQVGVLMKAAV